MTTQDEDRLKQRRSSIWLISGAVLILAVIFFLTYTYSSGLLSSLIYHYTHSGKWLYSTLYHGVKNGDTVEQVENLLGPGQKAGANIKRVVKKMAERTPASWFDGVEDNDTFLGFNMKGGAIYLQFRNGFLINFDPNEFSKYEEITMIGS